MPQAKGHNAFPTARQLLERALESPRGIRVPCNSAKHAWNLRMQCYTARSRSRTQSTKIYDASHPMHGNSPWDGLELTIEGIYLIIRPGQLVEGMGIEEL